MSAVHCANVKADRSLGAFWERQFCVLAARYGLCFTPNQLGRSDSASAWAMVRGTWRHYTLPDVVVWSHPGEHHEIKHKAPTRDGRFGLELYRLGALCDFRDETGQAVMYTIHRHDLAGGREARINDAAHWVTCSVAELEDAYTLRRDSSYVNGTPQVVDVCYWPTDLWYPLSDWWATRTVTHGS